MSSSIAPAPEKPRRLKVAIVHYWLIEMRGGERIVETLGEMFPDAVIFTHVYDPSRISASIRAHDIRTSFVNRLPRARQLLGYYLPLMPLALNRLDLSGFDLVISVESGPAKGVTVPEGTPHLCICCSPMRYIWGMQKDYQQHMGLVTRLVFSLAARYLRAWDRASSRRVGHMVSISQETAQRVRQIYGRETSILYPPVDCARFRPAPKREDFYLLAGQLTPYKRPELAVEAANRTGRRLIVIGEGEMMGRLRAMAGPTVSLMGWQPDDVLADHYARCKALIFPGEEDFGIVPVEAMASGAPVVALRRGGALDTVVDGKTGAFFDEPSVASLIGALDRFDAVGGRLDTDAIVAHAKKFDRTVFEEKLSALIGRLVTT